MKQVVQPVAGGPVQVLDVPRPYVGTTEVLVRTIASVISAGTEGSVAALARSNLLSKARARPDLVRQVVNKARSEGILSTAQTVRGRLAADLPLGYSAAGEVVAVGSAISGIRVGQIVATGGAGKANHAEYQTVPGLLCVPVPPEVSPQDAAFATVASISLHGLRLASVGPGSKVVVVGLGLMGQLAARLAITSGCDVAGIDPAPHVRDIAAQSGVLALDELGQVTTDRIRSWSHGRGADAVIVCASSSTSGPMTRTPELCRDRATVVVVGAVGLHLERTPFYDREISVKFARSYGPGRYETSYEDWAVDYPVGHVRWTEGRNLEAILDLMAAKRLEVGDLVSHVFDIGNSPRAYRLIEERSEPYLAIRLTYPGHRTDIRHPVSRQKPARQQQPSQQVLGVGWIGAGNFSAGTLLPAFKNAGFDRLVAVASASGLSALRLAERNGFEEAVSGPVDVIQHLGVDVVVVATPHETHANLVTQALTAGKHVWCEKPLALTPEDLCAVEAAWSASECQLMVGFNRRWSPAVQAAQQVLAGMHTPKFLVYRVAAGPVPDGHWYRDRRQGGRLLGEVSHFVDTAQALIGCPIEESVSVQGGHESGVPGNDAVVALRFADGSLATICYGSARPLAGKEWIEVSTGDHRVVIDDFRAVSVDSRRIWKGRQDKGHRSQAAAFWRGLRAAEPPPTEAMLATMAATITAAWGRSF